MSKHTPGPWKYLGRITTCDNGTMEWPTVECAFRRYIKPEGRTDDECEANARLIAAAPEMYEALQMFLAYHDQGGPLHFDTDAMWAKARNVIAKIEGGNNE